MASDPPLPEIAAFHCQQAVEKLLKGFPVLGGINFRRTHELGELGAAAVTIFPEIAALVAVAEGWTVWGVAFRYLLRRGHRSPDPMMRSCNSRWRRSMSLRRSCVRNSQ
jgi:hypothetical protein